MRSSSLTASPIHPHRTVRSLVRHMEGEPVVHPVAVPAGHGDDANALAVGVVDEHIEHRHAAQRRRVPVGQDKALPVLTLLTV